MTGDATDCEPVDEVRIVAVDDDRSIRRTDLRGHERSGVEPVGAP